MHLFVCAYFVNLFFCHILLVISITLQLYVYIPCSKWLYVLFIIAKDVYIYTCEIVSESIACRLNHYIYSNLIFETKTQQIEHSTYTPTCIIYYDCFTHCFLFVLFYSSVD